MMTLNDNKIDYIHWRSQRNCGLLEASRQASHDNEILSIIEKFREADLIN